MTRAAALLALALGACARAPPSPPAAPAAAALARARYRVEGAPRELQPAVARADAAIRTLRDRLAARRAAELASAGIGGAMKVCRSEAPALAAAVSTQTGVLVGRTGARARGGAAPPREWIAPLVAEISARRAADVPGLVVDLGDRVGVLRSIALTAGCLSCHGPAERVAPDVKAAAEPIDEGTGGYSDGDLRGYFWAEAAKRRR